MTVAGIYIDNRTPIISTRAAMNDLKCLTSAFNLKLKNEKHP